MAQQEPQEEEENRPPPLPQEVEGEVHEVELDPIVARVEADVVDVEDIAAGVMLTRVKKKANLTRTVNTVRVSFVDPCWDGVLTVDLHFFQDF